MPVPDDSISSNGSTKTTLAILGCGSLGTAILLGVLESIEYSGPRASPSHKQQAIHPQNRFKQHDASPRLAIPSKVIACVRTQASASRLATALEPFSTPVDIHQGRDSASVLLTADIIVLGCQPSELKECFGDASIRAAVRGKLLISILAGVTISDIEAIIDDPNEPSSKPTTIVRAMPNIASFARESMTVIEAPEGTPAQTFHVVDWLFGSIGTVRYITASHFDTCTALCASTPAFFAVMLEALVDGAVMLGLSRLDAQIMAAQAMKGSAALVLKGEHPVSVKEKVTTPGGSTIRGLLKLEQGNLRALLAGALIECKRAAEALGANERA